MQSSTEPEKPGKAASKYKELYPTEKKLPGPDLLHGLMRTSDSGYRSNYFANAYFRAG